MPTPAAYAQHGAELLDRFERYCMALQLSQGRPFALEEYQATLLGDYFDGVRETLVLIPKKNGKTTLLAALALYHLQTVPDADCVIGAASREQASIMFDQACGFIRRSPGLQKRMVPKRGFREIRSTKPGDSGRIRVLAADVDTADGVIPTLALVDELGRHKKPDLYGVFRDGLGPRDGQLVGISTAGDHPQSPLGLIRSAAHKLPSRRDGKYLYARSDDDGFALHEWSLAEEDDVDDMAVVKLVNPASWQTEKLLRQRHDSPSMMSWQWKRLACGIWITPEAVFISSEDWFRGEREEGLQPGDRITLGFDGSRFHDATALVGCRIEDGLLQLLGLWESPGGAREWEVPGNEVDALLDKVTTEYAVVRGYFDPPLWQSEIDAWASDFGEELVQRYYTSRSRMLAAVERFRTDIVGEPNDEQPRVLHVKDERLTRHVLNAQLSESRGGYKLEKGRSVNDYIDGAVAAVLAYEARCDAIAAGDDVDRSEMAFL